MSNPSPTVEEGEPAAAPMIPLSGALEFSPAAEGARNNYLLPSFQLTGFADTNPNVAPGSSKLETRSTYIGSLTLQRVKTHTKLNLDYAGGAMVNTHQLKSSTNASPSHFGNFHRLGITEGFNWQGLQVYLGDQASYLPESSFGFSGFGGLESFGSGMGGAYLAQPPVINSALLPSQTILTGRSRRVSNTAIAEAEYSQSGRSTFTVTGIYGTLHFLDPGFIDSNNRGVMAGYNHMLTPRDEVAVTYFHFLYDLGSVGREILSRGFQLSYNRQLTGKLSLRLSGGPVDNQISQPQGGSITRLSWDTFDLLHYHNRKNDASLQFIRYTTEGSGVLAGAESNVSRLSIGRHVSRRWHAGLEFGHTYNKALVRGVGISQSSKIETWEGGLDLGREFGPNTSFYLNYRLQRQLSNNPLCFSNTCETGLVRHVAGIGLNWHGRPIHIH